MSQRPKLLHRPEMARRRRFSHAQITVMVLLLCVYATAWGLAGGPGRLKRVPSWILAALASAGAVTVIWVATKPKAPRA